jgi:uncharacterized membrane protein
MKKQSSVIAVFKSHNEAEEAVKALEHSGFEMDHLSIVAKDYHAEEQVVGYYNAGDRMMYWGQQGAFWGGLWGMLFGSAFFLIPGIGPLVMAGPIVAWIVAALEGAVVVGGLSALSAAFFSIGIPENTLIEYETAIKAGKFVLIANGTASEISKAHDTIDEAKPEQIHHYANGLEEVGNADYHVAL